MTFALLGGLVALALIDSTSFGTLILPLILLVRPQVRHRQMAVYVVTIGAFYYLIGLVLLGAGDLVRARWEDVAPIFESTAAYAVQVAIGAGLVLLSYAIDPKYAHRFRRTDRAKGESRHGRWRAALLGDAPSPSATASVALGAGLVEVATMLPYLAAVAMITALGLPPLGAAGLLGGYVVVMLLPILALWGLRTMAGPRVEAQLRRVSDWFGKRSGSAIAWTVGIIGVLLLINGLPTLISRL